MAVTISFHAPATNAVIHNLSGSGLGFYGAAFGQSVDVGAYQTTTFITNSTGASQGPQINNVKWTHSGSGSINGAASVNLRRIPNYLCPLNIRVESDAGAIICQNSKIKIFDRTSVNSAASGVTTQVAEIIHPDTVQNNNGSGDTTWTEFTEDDGGVEKIFTMQSPGISGLSPNGAATSSTRHDFYITMSSSPDSIGSKTLYGLWFYTEYTE